MIAPDLETAIDELQRIGGGGARDRARSPAPEFPPSVAFRTSAHRAGCGPKTGRFRSMSSSPARTCATRRGGGASPWMRSFPRRGPAAGTSRWPALYRAGKAPAVITQNIDNLHQSSGIAAEHVIELHGNNSYALCLRLREALRAGMGARAVRAGARARARLRRLRRAYQDGDDLLRPGDARARDAPRRAADVLTVIFFSQSAPRWWCGRPPDFPCWPNETALVWSIINREATEFDEIADLVVREDIGTVLSPFIVH